MTNYSSVFACALDFLRALNERPWICKIVIRFVFGKYAYREFLLMIQNVKEEGFGPFSEYELENCDYHREEMKWKWWE